MLDQAEVENNFSQRRKHCDELIFNILSLYIVEILIVII